MKNGHPELGTSIRCMGCGHDVTMPVDSPVAGNTLCEACFLDRHGRPDALIPIAEAAAVLAEALAETLDLREHETGLHSRRVACHTLVLARRFDRSPEFLRHVYLGALLHDVGKIAVPDHILLKEGPLTDGEWDVMRRHPQQGYELLRRVPGLETAAEMVLAHEERFDGSGYPRGLSAADIPLGARLFAVIDTLDAITSDRSYRVARPFEQARQEIVRERGRQFDPLAVDAFAAEESVLREMVARKCTLAHQ